MHDQVKAPADLSTEQLLAELERRESRPEGFDKLSTDQLREELERPESPERER